AIASSDGTVDFWDPTTGKRLRPPIQAHKAEVTGMAFSPDSKLLATAGGRDHTAPVWALATREEGVPPWATSRGLGVGLRRDGKSLAAIYGGRILVWDTATRKVTREFKGQPKRGYCLAFHPDSRRLASGGWDETVRVWDLARGETPPPAVSLRGHAGHVLGVAFSPDGRRLASCGGYKGQGEIKIWDAALWE